MRSSRSHTIMTIQIVMNDEINGCNKIGKLQLVDLAGSERCAKTLAHGTGLAEAKSINQSLSTLGRLINAFNDPYAQHLPYRESKLTRILADSLGGNSKTCMIVTVSPHVQNKHESLSTLRYGSKAQKIKNKPQINTGAIKDLQKYKKVQIPTTPGSLRANQTALFSEANGPSENVQAQQALQQAQKQIISLDRLIKELRVKIQELECAHYVDQNQIRELRQIIIDLEKQLYGYQQASPRSFINNSRFLNQRSSERRIQQVSDLDINIDGEDKNCTEKDIKLGLALQRIVYRQKCRYAHRLLYGLKVTSLQKECQQNKKFKKKQKNAQKKLAALNLALLLEVKVNRRYMSFWHPCQTSHQIKKDGENVSMDSSVFDLDEDKNYSLSMLDTCSRSASLDNRSVSGARRNSKSVVGFDMGNQKNQDLNSTQERLAFSDLALLMSQQQMQLDKMLKITNEDSK